jgi:hypothetical protein
MFRLLLTTAMIVLCVFGAMPGYARADTIVVQQGGLVFDRGDPPGVFLEGDGVQLAGLGNITSSGLFACQFGCAIGTVLDFDTMVGGAQNDFQIGPAFGTVHGIGYLPDENQFFQLSLVGTLAFDGGTVTVPDARDNHLSLTAPFTFAGDVTGFRRVNEQPSGDPLFILDLTGRGRATLFLSRLDESNYQFLEMQYRFQSPAPIPEPATLMLVGGGLAGLWVRRRRWSAAGRSARGSSFPPRPFEQRAFRG